MNGAKDLEERLRAIGLERYHHRHPFHLLLHEGRLDRGQIQAWALNRYLYQNRIPIKDATLIARMDEPDLRRQWRRRLADHDGRNEEEGGVERWLKLTDGLGLDRERVRSEKQALPATRFAVEAYIHFVRERPLLEAIASSLTELFAPRIIEERMAGMLDHYPFIAPETLKYFKVRLDQAPIDSRFALDYCLEHAVTDELKDAVCEALIFKTQVLWAQLDALYAAYVSPGLIPPGCFVPESAS